MHSSVVLQGWFMWSMASIFFFQGIKPQVKAIIQASQFLWRPIHTWVG